MINITKSQPAPECLAVEKNKAKGNYRCNGVLERLHKDFYNKCYICEEKAPSTINVEHFKPHRGDKDLMFDWNNLFFACGHCNNTKGDKYDDIIDCTDNSNIVLDLLKFEIYPFPKENVRITALSDDKKVIATSQLLLEVYNGTTELKTMEGLNIRDRLLEEIRYFQYLLFDYYNDETTKEEKSDIRNKISKRLSPASAFTAFKHWIIKSNEHFYKEFREFL